MRATLPLPFWLDTPSPRFISCCPRLPDTPPRLDCFALIPRRFWYAPACNPDTAGHLTKGTPANKARHAVLFGSGGVSIAPYIESALNRPKMTSFALIRSALLMLFFKIVRKTQNLSRFDFFRVSFVLPFVSGSLSVFLRSVFCFGFIVSFSGCLWCFVLVCVIFPALACAQTKQKATVLDRL